MTDISFVPVGTSSPVVNEYEIVMRFLSRINPDHLEQEVLNRMGWGDSGTMSMALQVLMEEANELQH